MRDRRSALIALAALWITVLGVGFAAQATELFGTRNGIAEGLLLGAAALGFIAIGSTGVWLTLRWLERDQRRGRGDV